MCELFCKCLELCDKICSSDCKFDCDCFDCCSKTCETWMKDWKGENGIDGRFACKNRLNCWQTFCGPTTIHTTANTAAAAAAGIVIGGVTYIMYDKDKIIVNWDKVINAINTLDWTQLHINPYIPQGVVSELEILYNELIAVVKDQISEENIWTIMKFESNIYKEKLLQISNRLIPPQKGQPNFFSQKIQQMYPEKNVKQKYEELKTLSIAWWYKNTIKKKLKEKMNDEKFKDEIKKTYYNLISFIKQNNSVEIRYKGLDDLIHRVRVTTDNIYYIAPDGQNISFFDLLENQDERTKFQENYQKVFENMFGVPEEQIMLRF